MTDKEIFNKEIECTSIWLKTCKDNLAIAVNHLKNEIKRTDIFGIDGADSRIKTIKILNKQIKKLERIEKKVVNEIRK